MMFCVVITKNDKKVKEFTCHAADLSRLLLSAFTGDSELEVFLTRVPEIF